MGLRIVACPKVIHNFFAILLCGLAPGLGRAHEAKIGRYGAAFAPKPLSDTHAHNTRFIPLPLRPPR